MNRRVHRFAMAASVLLAGLAVPALGQDAARPYRDHVVVRVHAGSIRELQVALALTDDLWSHGAGIGAFDMRVSPAQRAALDAAGLRYEVLIADLEARIEAEAARLAANGGGAGGGAGGIPGGDGAVAADDWFLDFKNMAAIDARLDALAAANPGLVQVVTVGTTHEGRTIRGVRISRAADPANAPAFLFNGCQHAREWATPMTTMYVADRLIAGATSDARIAGILTRSAVYVIPVVNKDGYEYTWAGTANRLWRKNRQPNSDGSIGTDPNRNWGYGWGGGGSSGVTTDDTYRGPAAFSSPEVAALRDFYVARPQIVGSIDFHAYSQLILWPWGWTNALCADDAAHRAIGGGMRNALLASGGKTYTPGPIYTTIYPAAGGATDWTYGDQGVISYTIEVRDTGAYGFIMPAAEILPCARENYEASVAMMQGILDPAVVGPNGTLPATVPSGQATAVSILATPTTGAVTGATLRTRIGSDGAFDTVAMTGASGVWSASLPGAPCGRTIEYFFEVATTGGTVTYPAGGAAAPMGALAQDRTVVYEDTCETNAGWTVGSPVDNATSGFWVLVDPVGTLAQPEDDHTPGTGTRCWVTGQGAVGGAIGAADVDGGITTLTSPPLDGSDLGAVLVYERWYSNNQGSAPNADSMPVLWSRDGLTWTQLEDVSENAGAWVEKRWPLASFLTSPGPFRIRFLARDLANGSIVEAAVDDVRIERVGCAYAAADVNRDGRVDGTDLGLLLAAWGPANGSPADIDGNGIVDGSDLGQLLSGWAP
jgi:hypothetical protein